MNLNELVKEYRLLQDEEGRYYKLDDNSNRVEPFVNISFLEELSGLHVRTITRYLKNLNPHKCRSLRGRIVNVYDFNQVIQICPAILQLKHNITRLNDYVLIKGEKYAPLSFLAQVFSLRVRTVRECVKNLTHVEGKPLKGRHVKLYKVEEVKSVCARLINPQLVIANKNGMATIGKDLFAPLSVISKKIKVSKHNLKKRVKNLVLVEGKSPYGRLCAFYSLNQVINECSDLLNPSLIIAADNGWVIKSGKKYASLNLIAKELQISNEALGKRVKTLTVLKGKNRNNRLVDYYDFNQVKSACADILDSKLLIINQDGWVLIDGEKYAPLNVIAAELKISRYHLGIRVKGLVSFRGKKQAGKVTDLYCFNQVKSVCSDLLAEGLLIADKTGFANKDGQLYATINLIAKQLSISKAAVEHRVKLITPVKGMSLKGRIVDFYNFENSKSSCADLCIPGLLFAAGNGWAIKDGEEFAPLCIIAKKLKISTNAVNRRVKNLPSLPGKSRNNLVAQFYCLDDVKTACADLLIKKRKYK
jgi:hypothetical protein